MFDVTLAKLLQDSIDTALTRLNTILPGKVVSYDKNKCSINAAISLKKKYADGSIVDYPQLINIPVLFPRCNKAIIKLPIKKDDSVIIIIAQRSIDAWKSNGNVNDPKDVRKFNLSDAFAIVGGYSFNNVSDFANFNDTDLYIKNDQAIISLDPTGKIAIGINGTELLDNVSKFAGGVSSFSESDKTHEHPTAVGPSGPPIDPSPYISLKSLADSIKSAIDSIKGTLS